MITIIAQIKTTIKEAAQEVMDLFGEGARPDAEKIEDFFALNNSVLGGGYTRIRVAQHIAMALDYLMGEEITGEHIACLRVEWHGQDRVESTDPETGETTYVEEYFQTGTQDILDDEGNVIATVPVYLGRFA